MPSNGIDKRLAGAFGFFVIGLVCLVSAATSYYLVPEPHGLGDYFSPRDVTASNNGSEWPNVQPEAIVVTNGRRCVHAEKPVLVNEYPSFVPIDALTGIRDFMRPTVPGPTSGSLVPRQPGCFDERIGFTLPKEVAPGLWRVEVVERAPDSGELRSWFSETFLVAERLQ